MWPSQRVPEQVCRLVSNRCTRVALVCTDWNPSLGKCENLCVLLDTTTHSLLEEKDLSEGGGDARGGRVGGRKATERGRIELGLRDGRERVERGRERGRAREA